MRRATALAIVLSVCGAFVPGHAAALARAAGRRGRVLPLGRRHVLNTLHARVSGNRIEFRDDTVDGGMDPGNCTPGDVDASGYIVQTFCPLAAAAEGAHRPGRA